MVLPYEIQGITSWTWHANLLSILFPHKESMNWIYSNYIGLCYTKADRDKERAVVDFWPRYLVTIQCPFVKTQIIDRDTINRFAANNIVSFFKWMIEKGSYIYGVFCEEFEYDHEYYHEMCISGFDDQSGEFVVNDFWKNGKFAQKRIPYQQVESGYQKVSRKEDYFFEWRGGIHFLEYDEAAKYELNCEQIGKAMEAYVLSENLSNDYSVIQNPFSNYSWGISVYDALEKEFHTCGIDIRSLAVLKDHKAIAVDRIKYLILNKVISQEYMKLAILIKNKTEIMLNLAIKGVLTKTDVVPRICKMLAELKTDEQMLYEKLSKELRRIGK